MRSLLSKVFGKKSAKKQSSTSNTPSHTSALPSHPPSDSSSSLPGERSSAGGPEPTPVAEEPVELIAHIKLSKSLFPGGHVYGARVLHEPANPLLDIVFVHGLKGHPFRTWFEPDEEIYWPTQLLAKDIPDARILTFGYDADVTKFLGPVSQSDLRDHAHSLVNDLANVRMERNERSRKIVFVVHSLGGLVVKKALCLSDSANKPHQSEISEHTIAVAFLGTPHRGSDLAPYASFLAQALKSMGKRTNTERLQVLARNSEVLADVDDSFSLWLQRNMGRFDLTCFFEELELPGVGLVVKTESATIKPWPQQPIHANHMGMARFNSPDDQGYRRIKNEITRWIIPLKEKPSVTRNLTADEKGCLKSLSFPEMHYRQSEIKPSKGTCQWLLASPEYQSWLSNQRGLLWIKGHPGTGKSTLMKFALENLPSSDRKWANRLTIQFFFHGRGSPMQKTPEGLFRSLVHQLLQRFPSEMAEVVNTFKARRDSRQDWSWHPTELETFLESCLPRILVHCPIRIFIDALDESGEKQARSLVAIFKQLLLACSSSRLGLSICFSCRHYPIVGLDGCTSICAEQENHTDIKHFIRTQFEYSFSEEQRLALARLEGEIEARSKGVFQWVALVLPDIIWGYAEGMSLRQLQEKLQAIPQELDELYGSIINTLLLKDKARTLKLFRWVLFAMEPLTVVQLRCAMNTEPTAGLSSMLKVQDSSRFTGTNLEMERQMRTLSGGLVHLSTDTPSGSADDNRYVYRTSDNISRVQFIHQSVIDYLLANEMESFFPTKTPVQDFTGLSHLYLCQSCVVYFSMADARNAANICLPEAGDRSQHPLLYYTIKYWLEHARLAEQAGVLQGALLGPIERSYTETVAIWGRLTQRVRFPHELLWLRNAGILQIAAVYNLESVVRTILKAQNSSALITQNHIDVNMSNEDGRTALSWAAEHGYEGIVRLLIQREDIKPDRRDQYERTALSWAAQHGYEGIVRLLVQREDVEADTCDKNGQTPLFHAAAGGHEAVVRLLVQREDVKVDRRDNYGRTALSWAASGGHEAVVQLLVERQDVEANRRGEYLWGALSFAVEKGHEAVVRLLVQQDDIQINRPDLWGYTALILAKLNDHDAIVKLLQEYGAK